MLMCVSTNSELPKMGCKAFLVLVMFLATIFVMSTEVAPRELNEKLDQNAGELNPTNGVDESKYWYGYGGPWRGGGFGGPWRGGYGGGFGGPWHGGYGGPWRGGGYCPWCWPKERAEANIEAKPYN